jgi:hypothetical protein
VKDIVLKIRLIIMLPGLICFGFLFCFTHQSLAFFKSIPEQVPQRTGYLTFQSPPMLRFHEIAPTADRKKLLSLEDNEVLTTEITPVKPAASVGEFPLVSYDTDANNSHQNYEIPLNNLSSVQLSAGDNLPPADPFVPMESPEGNLNNTDELIEILESNSGTQSNRLKSMVEFIPPYTIDQGNMILESKSKYVRRVRN